MEHAESAMMGLSNLQALILHAHCAEWNWLCLSYQVLFLIFYEVCRLIVNFLLHLLCSWFHKINHAQEILFLGNQCRYITAAWTDMVIIEIMSCHNKPVPRLPLPHACCLPSLYCLLYHFRPVKNLDNLAAMLFSTQKLDLSLCTASPLNT